MVLVEKSALVTGGASGIGKAICEEFLKNKIANLAVLDLSTNEPEIVQDWKKNFPKSSIKYFRIDVASQEDLEKCYEDYTNTIPSLDIVVNCAGIFNEYSYRRVVEVNLCGVIGSTLLAVEHMRADKGKGKGGAIINIASVAGVFPMSHVPTYGATKHGVVIFTRSLAHGRDNMGIKFLTLCPGGTHTPLVAETFIPKCFFEMNEETFQRIKASYKYQDANKVSDALMKILEKGKSGSVWIIENGQLTEFFGTSIAV